jgi:2-polyprenyl-3-methyl-5-hydroxy-6-metoxy-1,4-benzoquinol methylase
MVWQQDVLKAQRIVAENSEGTYYLDKYMNDEFHYWHTIPYWMSFDSVERRVDNVLDIGCGYGTLLVYSRELYKCNCYGLDMNDTLGKLKDMVPITFSQNNIETDDIPFDEEFDAIIFTECIEHLHSCPIPTLNKLTSVLSDEGRLFLSTPDACSWGRNDKFYEHLWQMPMEYKELETQDGGEHIYHFYENDLRFMFEKVGLKVEKMARHQPPSWGAHLNFQLCKE